MRSQIILDYSANTHKNDLLKIQEAINAISLIDTKKHEIVFKSQLFREAGENVVCKHGSFDFMYNRCKELGYKCTASVFDKSSLYFLLKYDIPFVKIANNRDFDYLIDYVPRRIPVYTSHDCSKADNYYNNKSTLDDQRLRCVSEYPAKIKDYRCVPGGNISDHTIGFELFKTYKPKIYEKHFIMPGDDGLDSGPFAVTPEDLRQIL